MLPTIYKSFSLAFLVLSLFSSVTNSWAQKNRITLNPGLTFGNENAGPAANAQYFITNGLSIGPQYYAIKEENTLSINSEQVYSQQVTASFIGLRGEWHMNTVLHLNERIDPYVGILAGKILLAGKGQVASGPVVSENRTYDGITVYAPVGVRYWFGRHVGVYADYNLGIANVTADINGNGKKESFYEKRQYQVGVGLSVRF